MQTTIAIVGRGRMGRALAAALRLAGHPVEGPLGRGARAEGAGVVLLCVPDGQIAAAAVQVAPGRLVGHCSGATGLDVLAPHEAFSLHPLMTVTEAGGRFAGAGCAVDGATGRALDTARALASDLGMRPVMVAGDRRAAYHAAASIASNFLLTVEAAAERLAATAGVDRELLAPLVRATIDTWEAEGAEAALTGPVARGDEGTIARQRSAIASSAPDLLPLFDALTTATRELAGRRPTGGQPDAARAQAAASRDPATTGAQPAAAHDPASRDPAATGAAPAASRDPAATGAGPAPSSSPAGAMRIVRTVAELRATLRAPRRTGATIGLVPTMGALHDGHLSLVARAREVCDVVVVSLFVNAAQFDEAGDLAAYPRDEARDAELAARAGADLLFAPAADEVYPAGFSTRVHVAGLTEPLEGAYRGASHFDAVATVVTKLLNMAGPDVAFFGQKDAQQALVIRRLVRDLDLPVRIEVCPTIREPDGLALSSRNVHLGDWDREHALALRRALLAAERAVEGGERDARAVERAARGALNGFAGELDYLALVDAQTLDPVEAIDGDVLVAVAARVGVTRLIDNTILSPS